MRKYETLFVLKTNMEEAARVALIEKFTGIIANDGEVTNVDEWGSRKLAYEIEKLTEGYYVLVDFKANPELPRELERNFKISDDVLRYVVINKEEK
ncbi:30S ribosomal protein S6 [Acidaminobacter sp. JC074]|uniref:30S ribosomal protein S6 n=1 Tax=Acidaminobacter sp. JC074 TaxID=2530199 RepID=UPI001F0FF2BF|nr:30S ribosomal protein S6 [Acidaminobacter sp. JC074]MCH4887349.1 30S ribosomal protein S6 [Acidaminobacter sp. JC074]